MMNRVANTLLFVLIGVSICSKSSLLSRFVSPGLLSVSKYQKMHVRNRIYSKQVFAEINAYIVGLEHSHYLEEISVGWFVRAQKETTLNNKSHLSITFNLCTGLSNLSVSLHSLYQDSILVKNTFSYIGNCPAQYRLRCSKLMKSGYWLIQ